ncbi:MAG: DUF1905 domain-containing protein [Oligoflexia bacterium]|nr:DUF1905 domain-containing protein [Oligoflexia bacterium]
MEITDVRKSKLKKYGFKGKVWKHKGPASWHFVTLPQALSKIIRKTHGISEEGWGRLRTTALVGGYKWKTAIWYDTKAVSYILPLKASVRKKLEIQAGSAITVSLFLQYEELRIEFSATRP